MNFQDLQRRFCAHMRDPENTTPPPGLNSERLGLYRRLVYRNIESFFALSFPQFKARAGNRRWHGLVRDFIRSGRTTSPIFHELPGLFVLWLSEEGLDSTRRADALLEQMAHFAWVQHDLDFSTETHVATEKPADALREKLQWSKLARALSYSWPVHRIRPGPVEPEPAHLLVWRDGEDRVHWQQTSPVSVLLAQRADSRPATGSELIDALTGSLKEQEHRDIRSRATESLHSLLEMGLLQKAA